MLGVSLLCALTGSALVADWQAIGHDHCSSANTNNAVIANVSNYSYKGTHNEVLYNNKTSESEVTNTSLSQELYDSCKALSNSSVNCFWNPQSRITGEFCNTCVPSCRSEEKSLIITQFIIGALLVALSAPLGFTFISAITSDITPIETQVDMTIAQ